MLRKLLGALGTLFLCSSFALATTCTSTTVSSTGVVDLDGMTWAGGTVTINLQYPPQVFSFSAMSCANGGTLLPQYTATMTSAGAFSVSIPANSGINPTGSQWVFTLCPKATSGCYNYTATITGASQNLTAGINAVLPGPRFNAGMFNSGYSVAEINTTVPTGAMFYNTTVGSIGIYNGSGWSWFFPTATSTSTGITATPNVSMVDDFCGNTPATTPNIGNLQWDSTVLVSGTNPVAAVASVVNHPCLITLTTDTTATHGVGITLGHAVGTLFPGNSTNWQSLHIAEINQITSGSYRIGFGTVDTATAIPTNGIYFRFLQGTDTFISACSDSTSTETCTPTTITPTAGDYIEFSMNSTTTGAVNFTVTDITTPATSTVSLCASGCTAVATLPTVVLSPMFNIAETGSSAADVLTVDYFSFQQIPVR